MRKATFVLLAGAVCGATATWLLVDAPPAATTAADTSFLETLTGFASRGSARDASGVNVTARLAAYRSAAAQAEPATIEAALERAARAERTAARDLEIDALLARLGELDAAHAARTAQRLDLDARFVADAWLTWAERDADAALAALDSLAAPSVRRAAALALLDVFGSSMPSIERVAAVLPTGERASFEVEALAYKAERDAYGAFRDALALRDVGTRQRAVQEVAIVWAQTDPEGAFAEAALAPEDVRPALQQSVSAEWARLDPSGFIRALPSLDINTSAGGIQLALATDPEGVIRAMEGVQAPIAQSLRAAAVAALAQVDVEAAKTRVAALPPGQERDQALQQVASAYARVDPDAALAWAESMGANTAVIQRSIMLGIAASGDIDRAMSLAASGAAGIEADLVTSLVASRATQDPREARRLANELVGKEDAQSKTMLARLVTTWVQREPDGALEWVLSQGAAADPATIGNMARSFATRDGAAAAAYADRVPPQLRPTWLAQVAGPYGRSDPAGAMRWLERFQGQEGYDVALRQMATQAAQTDPRAAATMLERATGDVQLGAAQTIAANWARSEPEAAARWATTLTDQRARTSAVMAAATAWASADPAAAESWALTLAPGAPRDDVLTALLPRFATTGQPLDGRLIAGFSTAEARNNALVRVLPMLRAQNPAEAQRLLDAYVTDPAERQRLEQQLVRPPPQSPPSTVIDSSGNVIVIR